MAKQGTELRKHMDDQFVQHLVLINGGGIVVLLAFVQALWGKHGAPETVRFILFGMVAMAIGLVLAALSPVLRRHVSLLYESNDDLRFRREKLSWRVQFASLGLFLLGTILVVFGMFRGLQSFDQDGRLSTGNNGSYQVSVSPSDKK